MLTPQIKSSPASKVERIAKPACHTRSAPLCASGDSSSRQPDQAKQNVYPAEPWVRREPLVPKKTHSRQEEEQQHRNRDEAETLRERISDRGSERRHIDSRLHDVRQIRSGCCVRHSGDDYATDGGSRENRVGQPWVKNDCSNGS